MKNTNKLTKSFWKATICSRNPLDISLLVCYNYLYRRSTNELIEYYKSRVGHLFIFKSSPTRFCILCGGFMTEFGLGLTFKTVGWRGYVCTRGNFSLFGQVSDDEMRESKFIYAFPNQVIDVTND